jgi:4-amino-4-deoxy-L-arabinose transferase-like glycosyltransferase
MSEAVLSSRVPTPTERDLATFARWPVFSIAGLVAVVHLVFSPTGGYWLDEAYMLAAGKFHPAFGYADQPPLAPLLAAAMDRIAPDSIVVLRLPAVLATAAAVVLTALIARELGGDRRAQTLSAGAAATGLFSTYVGHWITPYTFEPALWLLLIWVLLRWVRLREAGHPDDRLLLVIGVVIGLTMQTKFQVALLCVALLISVLLVGPRDLLRRPKFWGGVGIALLLALSTLVWQATHGWPQLRMGAVVARESPRMSNGHTNIALYLVVFAGVAGTGLFLLGLWKLLRSAELRPYRFFGVTIVLLYGLFTALPGRPYYLMSLYGIAIAAGALALQRRRETRRTRFRWAAWPTYAASVLAAGYFLWLSTAQTIPRVPMPESDALAKETAAAYAALPPQEHRHTAIMGGHYVLAAALEVEREQHGLPPVYSPHRGYGYFDIPGNEINSVLLVGWRPAMLLEHFTEIRQVRQGDVDIWLCTGRRGAWPDIWAKIRSL